MIYKIINTKKEYHDALSRLNDLFMAEQGTPEFDEAELWGLLIKDYENRNFHFETPSPIDAIKIRMEELNLKQKDLVKIIGTKSLVSEILNKKRHLTLKMIRQLNSYLNIPLNVLVQNYTLLNKNKLEKI